jgi:hypothetical protein
VVLDGNRITTAFAFKGPAKFEPMTLAQLGKNGGALNAARQAEELSRKECFAKKPLTWREYFTCATAARERIYRPYLDYPDLFEQEQAYKLVLADEMDAKRITWAEARFKYSQLESQLATERLRRDKLRQSAPTIAAQSQRQPQQQPQETQGGLDPAAAAVLANGLSNLFRSAPVASPPPRPIYTPSPSLNCTSVPIANTVSTHCY